MNVAGHVNRMIVRNPDEGGSSLHSGSKGLKTTGLFAAAGFMDLLAPARMESDPRKGAAGEIPLFGVGSKTADVEEFSVKNTINIAGSDLDGEGAYDLSAGASLDGLLEEVDRSLVAGVDPSELLANLLHDDLNMSGGIFSSDTSSLPVSEVEGRSTSESVRTGQVTDKYFNVNAGRMGTDQASVIAGLDQGMSRADFQKEMNAPLETMLSLDSGGSPGKDSEDIGLESMTENIRGSEETQKSRSISGSSDMNVDSLAGRSVENLEPGGDAPLSGQILREMDDSRLKAERESVRMIHSSSGSEEIQEQIPGLSEAGEQGNSMLGSDWSMKEEFLEMAGRSVSDEIISSRAVSREIPDENVAVIHPAEAAKRAGKVKKISSTQRLQVLDSARQGLVEQIGNVVSRNGVQEIKMFLSPPELGEMKIRVEVRGKRIRATILVESAAVKGAVDGGTGRLAEAVMNEGFVLENLDVSVNDTDKHTGWNMSDDDIPVEGPIADRPVNTSRRAEMVRNDPGGIDLLV